MPTDQRAALASIRRFDQLIAYLRDEMGWPITRDSFQDADDLFYDFTADELGIDPKTAAKIESIKRLRPLSARQPWGIFFVKFEPKRLPVVALRRILSQVALKKRATANSAERAAWATDDLLFVSNYGEGDQRQISFAHFSQERAGELSTLKVLGWDNLDTPLHLDQVAEALTAQLAWPDDETDVAKWRETWRSAFTLGHREVVTTSKALAIRLAHLARMIRDRIQTTLAIETQSGPMTRLMKVFREALIHDLTPDDFADMYAQTLAYGLLSARITDPKGDSTRGFAARLPVTNPFLKELMETFLHDGTRREWPRNTRTIDFDELGISEVGDLLDDANMEAVVRDFGDRNPQEDPVIHFYELFLKEYDAKKRMQRGVFYTPRPVVSYIVRSVDDVLRSEFGLKDGLADTTTWSGMAKGHNHLKIPEGVPPDQAFVQVLDPATGTGTFLVEAISVMHQTLVDKWRDEGQNEEAILNLWNDYVPKHLLPRLHGYELLMAPYAIAHLKIGLKLLETGYRFGSDERARIYLTNALEPANDQDQMVLEGFLPALAHEARAVNEIKREQRFTVVIGNPPYSNFGQLNRIPYILDLLDVYKRDLNEKKLNLDDDFIKFIRLSESLAEGVPAAVLGMITNNTFLDGPTRRAMREHLLTTFDSLAVVDLHGNSIEREVCADGSPDENVFEIQQGVAISLFVRRPERGESASGELAIYDLQGTRDSKYEWLAKHAAALTPFESALPVPPLFLFQVTDVDTDEEYSHYAALSSVFGLSGSGVKTDRDPLCFDMDRMQLVARMETAFAGNLSQEFVSEYNITDSSSYALTSRLGSMSFDESAIMRCLYRPFDERWLYYQPGFTSRPAWTVMRHMLKQNLGLVAKRQARGGQYDWFFVAKGLMVDGLFSIDNKGREQLFPLYIYTGGLLGELLPNLSGGFMTDLAECLGPRAADAPGQNLKPESAFGYIYSVFHSPAYRRRYASQLPTDYPRVPLPMSAALFERLSALGLALIDLHLMESASPVKFITTYTGPNNAEVRRVEWWDDTVWLDAGTGRGQPAGRGTIGFHGVSEEVWGFHIGGHQVCEKWLKDRKARTLSDDDIAHYHKIVAAVAETIRLMKEIDEVIEQHGGWPGAFHAAHPSSLNRARPDLRKVAEPPTPPYRTRGNA